MLSILLVWDLNPNTKTTHKTEKIKKKKEKKGTQSCKPGQA